MYIEELTSIILDLDGPILDCRNRHYRCYCDIVTNLGREPLPLAEYWKKKRMRTGLKDQLVLIGLANHIDEFSSNWLEKIEQKKYLEYDVLQSGIHRILGEWVKYGIKLILATMRNSPDNLAWQLSHLGIDKYFEKIAVVNPIGHEGSTSKADAVRNHVDKTFLKNSLWIGDTELDIQSARMLDIPVCLVDCGIRDPEILAALQPDYHESDIESFALKFSKTVQ